MSSVLISYPTMLNVAALMTRRNLKKSFDLVSRWIRPPPVPSYSVLGCSFSTVSIRTRIIMFALVSSTRGPSRSAACCAWSRISKPRYVISFLEFKLVGSLVLIMAPVNYYHTIDVLQMYRLTVRSSKEDVSIEVCELLIDQI